MMYRQSLPPQQCQGRQALPGFLVNCLIQQTAAQPQGEDPGLEPSLFSGPMQLVTRNHLNTHPLSLKDRQVLTEFLVKCQIRQMAAQTWVANIPDVELLPSSSCQLVETSFHLNMSLRCITRQAQSEFCQADHLN
jgi:hypothetical protein